MIEDEDESKDITQEVFITIFEKHSSFRRESSLQTWILKVAYNHALKHIGKKGRFVHAIDESFHDREDIPESWEMEEQYEALQNSIGQLNAGEQLYLELFYTNGCSIREMSRILGKTETAVKTGLSRVRAKLGGIMNKRYGEI